MSDHRNPHLSVDPTETDEDGWFYATCSCGFQQGPLPGVEEVCDFLMQHARERALIEDLGAVGGAVDA